MSDNLDQIRAELSDYKATRKKLIADYQNDRAAIFERLNEHDRMQIKLNQVIAQLSAVQAKNKNISKVIKGNRRVLMFTLICVAFIVFAGGLIAIDIADNGRLDWGEKEFNTITGMAGSVVALSAWVAAGKADSIIK